MLVLSRSTPNPANSLNFGSFYRAHRRSRPKQDKDHNRYPDNAKLSLAARQWPIGCDAGHSTRPSNSVNNCNPNSPNLFLSLIKGENEVTLLILVVDDEADVEAL